MKSERRHELQHNQLADWLVKTGQALQPYQNLLMAAVLVVVVLVLGVTLWSRHAAAKSEEAWDALNTVMEGGDLTRLAGVIDDFPKTPTAYTAAVILGDVYLAEGCDQLFKNKMVAKQKLAQAISRYLTVREEADTASSLHERATFGLARAYEARGDKQDLEEASRLYDECAAKWSDGAYAVIAGRRAADLSLPATKRLYDRFALFDPKPVFEAAPSPGAPLDLNTLPQEGPAYMPPTTFNLDPNTMKPGDAKKSEPKPVDEKKTNAPATDPKDAGGEAKK
jgi:hypothetical protein